MKKMVVNHIDKTFVTSDAATILREVLEFLIIVISPTSSSKNGRYGQ